jgi:hypothetical protein
MSKGITVLRNSNEIREAVWRLFSAPKARRVALVAYVGADAQEYLPYPAGIELICWDKEGSTDPDAVRTLRSLKVKVSFARNLHMKVFWVEKRGVIIGSANLSNNGLSDNGLHEVAVLLPANSVDIKGLKARVNAEPVTPSSLRDLDTRTLQHRSRNAGKDAYPTTTRKSERKPIVTTFANWYESEDRKFWRLYSYGEYFRGLTAEAKHELQAWGYKTCEDYWMGADCHANPHEWLLGVDTNKYGYGVYWSCADFTVPVKRSDKEFYDRRWPFFSVQIRPTRKYGKPPFKIDRAFIKATKRLLTQAEVKTYMNGLEFAPNGLLRKRDLKRLYEYYLEESGGK